MQTRPMSSFCLCEQHMVAVFLVFDLVCWLCSTWSSPPLKKQDPPSDGSGCSCFLSAGFKRWRKWVCFCSGHIETDLPLFVVASVTLWYNWSLSDDDDDDEDVTDGFYPPFSSFPPSPFISCVKYWNVKLVLFSSCVLNGGWETGSRKLKHSPSSPSRLLSYSPENTMREVKNRWSADTNVNCTRLSYWKKKHSLTHIWIIFFFYVQGTDIIMRHTVSR